MLMDFFQSKMLKCHLLAKFCWTHCSSLSTVSVPQPWLGKGWEQRKIEEGGEENRGSTEWKGN